jgi:hypothetical protein
MHHTDLRGEEQKERVIWEFRDEMGRKKWPEIV